MIPGHPNQVGFTTMNGINWGVTSTDEELAMRIRCIGIAKTPYTFDDVNQLKHGFASIFSGTGTTFNTGENEFFPGDVPMWDVIPRPSRPGGRLPGGQYGDDGPGSRQGNPRAGTERTRFRFRINPSRFNDMRPAINPALSAMVKPRSQGGVMDLPFEHVFQDARRGGFAKPTPNQEHAAMLLTTMAVTMTSGIALLVENGLLAYAGGVTGELDLVKKVGIFGTTPTDRVILHKLINTWFLGYSVNRQASASEFAKIAAAIPNGFNRARNTVVRNESLDSRYVQVRTNLANLQELGFARAVHSVTRRQLGTALSYSKKGQRVDIMLQTFSRAY
jgi:hypothetical protein